MKAALLYGPADLRVVEADVPEPAPDEALVRIARYSPYGTDVAVYQGDPRLPPPRYPMGIGADLSGVIVQVGSKVQGFAVGDRVAAAALAHCGTCAQCRRGRSNRCLDPAHLNPPRQVACQQYAVVSAGKLARLPAGVSFDEAALLVAAIDALNAHERLNPAPGDTLAVIGVGAMGLGAIATFRALGHPVLAIGGTGRRADLAQRMGCRDVIRLARHDEDVSGQVRTLSPAGIDCVMETTATDWGVALATKIAAMGGRVALTGGGPVTVTAWDLVFRELSVFGVKAGTQQDQALKLIAQGRLLLGAAITHRMRLEQAPEAFRLLAGPARSDVGRIMIEVDDFPDDTQRGS
jgi:threonine dehydrogenase-like Zn-dependent dehydrogenase